MDRDSPYYRQVQLLFGTIPYVATENCFALKGGTAINLFHLPMPRLSVDIDLTYVPIEDRETGLRNASEALQRIVDRMTCSTSNYYWIPMALPGKCSRGFWFTC